MPARPLLRGVRKKPNMFFLLNTALKDSPRGPPTANRQPPTDANRQPPPTANRQPSFNTVSVVLCPAHVVTMKQKRPHERSFLLA